MLDSANLEEIRQVKELGVLGGVTTNPLIIKRGIKESRYRGRFLDLAKRILELAQDKPVFFQVVGHTVEELEEQAKRIYEQLRRFGNPHIKVPFNPALKEKDDIYAGLKAMRRLKDRKIPVLATAIVTPTQAFLAALTGVDYSVLMLRPYDNIVAEELGLELKEDGFLDNDQVMKACIQKNKTLPSSFFTSGLENLRRTSRMFREHSLETKLLVAGIRNVVQLSSVIEEGVDAVTLPFKVFYSVLPHEGTRRFVRDTYEGCPKMYRRFLDDKR